MIFALAIDDINIKRKDRQRQDFKDKGLESLADSIEQYGLIHAPVVQSDGRTLVAGERRIRAMAIIFSRGGHFQYGADSYTAGHIPLHVLDEYNDTDLYAIELEENLRRESLTPMEEAQAIARLHEHVGTKEGSTGTVKETAEQIADLEGRNPTSSDESRVAASILVDQFKDDPDVQKAAKVSLTKGAKVAREKMEREFRSALAGLEEDKGTGSEENLFNITHGDSKEVLQKVADNTYDIMIFDPPYGMDAQNFGEQAFSIGHEYDDSEFGAAEFTVAMLIEAQRILKEEAHILQFCNYESVEDWMEMYEVHGFNVWPRPLIWSKGHRSHAPQPDHGPRYSYECIIYARKGKPRTNKLINDVINVPSVTDKVHAAEKPAELFVQLIDMVARPGDRIIDPCCGSGPIFLGARGKEVYVDGVEMHNDYYLIAKERAHGYKDNSE